MVVCQKQLWCPTGNWHLVVVQQLPHLAVFKLLAAAVAVELLLLPAVSTGTLWPIQLAIRIVLQSAP